MKISVVMTSYNYAQYIGEAIESVIRQTYSDWELIIVDDCSKDNSVDVIKKYLDDTRIKLYVNNENLGLAKTLQIGISKAQADWIAFLESDDLFAPNSLEEKAKAVQTGADIIFTDVELFGDKNRIDELRQKYFDVIDEKFVKLDRSKFIENFAEIIPIINIIPTFSSVMLRRRLLIGCNFNSLCKAQLDKFLWVQISMHSLYYLNEKLTHWRVHKDSYSSREHICWFKNCLFSVSLFWQTVRRSKTLSGICTFLNFARVRFIYMKINKNVIKLNIGNGRFIFEKKLK